MEWFNSLPIYLQTIIIIIVIVSTVIVSIYGGIRIQKSKTDLSINIGGDSKLNNFENRNKVEDVYKKVRKCEDCFMILRDYLLKVERRIRSLEDSKFYKPLNILDQKLEELTTVLINDYLDQMNNQATDEEKASGETIKQLRLFEAHIKDACGRIKIEIRRALRENGFAKLSSLDFMSYVKSEINVVINFIQHHIRSVYPSNSSCMILDINEVLKIVENRQSDIAKIIESFFHCTVEIINQVDEEIKKIEKESIEWCENFIHQENSVSILTVN